MIKQAQTKRRIVSLVRWYNALFPSDILRIFPRVTCILHIFPSWDFPKMHKHLPIVKLISSWSTSLCGLVQRDKFCLFSQMFTANSSTSCILHCYIQLLAKASSSFWIPRSKNSAVSQENESANHFRNSMSSWKKTSVGPCWRERKSW